MGCLSNSFKGFDLLKNMAARGRGHFSIYGFFVNFSYFQHISVITFTKWKIFSSNFTNLFTITRATFWPKDTTLYCTYLPLRTFKNTDVAIASIILKLFMPPNKIWGIIKSDHPSVRLFVCPFVRPSVHPFEPCPEFFSAIFQWIFLKLCILVCHYRALCTCNFGHDHLNDQ